MRKGVVALLLTTCALVIVLAVTTVVVISQISRAGNIPTVTNVSGSVATGTTVVFSWPDPGVTADDSYQIETADGSASTQRSSEFTIDADAGERVCVTVSVNREGKLGEPSGEKCVEVPAGAAESRGAGGG